MSRQRGWVSVSVQTYQSHRTSAQRITQTEYTVDETGATLNAQPRDAPEEEPEQQASTTPTTSIIIRDWKVCRHTCRAFTPALLTRSPLSSTQLPGGVGGGGAALLPFTPPLTRERPRPRSFLVGALTSATSGTTAAFGSTLW